MLWLAILLLLFVIKHNRNEFPFLYRCVSTLCSVVVTIWNIPERLSDWVDGLERRRNGSVPNDQHPVGASNESSLPTATSTAAVNVPADNLVTQAQLTAALEPLLITLKDCARLIGELEFFVDKVVAQHNQEFQRRVIQQRRQQLERQLQVVRQRRQQQRRRNGQAPWESQYLTEEEKQMTAEQLWQKWQEEIGSISGNLLTDGHG